MFNTSYLYERKLWKYFSLISFKLFKISVESEQGLVCLSGFLNFPGKTIIQLSQISLKNTFKNRLLLGWSCDLLTSETRPDIMQSLAVCFRAVNSVFPLFFKPQLHSSVISIQWGQQIPMRPGSYIACFRNYQTALTWYMFKSQFIWSSY